MKKDGRTKEEIINEYLDKIQELNREYDLRLKNLEEIAARSVRDAYFEGFVAGSKYAELKNGSSEKGNIYTAAVNSWIDDSVSIGVYSLFGGKDGRK